MLISRKYCKVLFVVLSIIIFTSSSRSASANLIYNRYHNVSCNFSRLNLINLSGKTLEYHITADQGSIEHGKRQKIIMLKPGKSLQKVIDVEIDNDSAGDASGFITVSDLNHHQTQVRYYFYGKWHGFFPCEQKGKSSDQTRILSSNLDTKLSTKSYRYIDVITR